MVPSAALRFQRESRGGRGPWLDVDVSGDSHQNSKPTRHADGHPCRRDMIHAAEDEDWHIPHDGEQACSPIGRRWSQSEASPTSAGQSARFFITVLRLTPGLQLLSSGDDPPVDPFARLAGVRLLDQDSDMATTPPCWD
ncbi:hypothetical protein MW887_010735 [Aspergillus wentii]|nr:hypothetical protein MW887_010735 [Aspergillus wentii]